MKGWLFERDIELSEKLLPDGRDAEQEFQVLRREMLGPIRPSLNEKEKRAMYDSCLCKCLRSRSPMEQKNFGRRCRNFDIKVWDVASVPVVVACQIARAEADDELRRLYLQSGDRVFVEGSPRDNVWGVGIPWHHVSIENPSNWRGENRLGVCHGIACKAVRELWKGKADAEQVG